MIYVYMKFLLIFISIVPIMSLSKKLCINCRHFIKPKSQNEIGKCELFPILNNFDQNQYLDSNQSRGNYMCGKKGRYYEKLVPDAPFLTLVDPSFFDDFSEFDFEQYIQFL